MLHSAFLRLICFICGADYGTIRREEAFAVVHAETQLPYAELAKRK